MTPEIVYATWAPRESPWSAWVKPVLFTYAENKDAAADVETITSGLPAPDPQCALLIDLPGTESLSLGLACSSLGWRPIPTYNSLPVPGAVIKTDPLIAGLWAGAGILYKLNLPAAAPPAFLLDARRVSPLPWTEQFDNRLLYSSSDLPSATFLSQRGILRVRVITRSAPLPDVRDVLETWRARGLRITVQPFPGSVFGETYELQPPGFLRRIFWKLFPFTLSRGGDGQGAGS